MSGRAPASMRDVTKLAWPAILSFVLNNGYRINDQFWVQGLGAHAQAAIAACTFLLITNFGLIYLVAGGALPIVARATGARDPEARDMAVRHALLASVILAVVLGFCGHAAMPQIAGWLGLEGAEAIATVDYMRAIYLGILPLALAPLVDNVFIAMGETRVPMALQIAAVATNLLLNPLLIYVAGLGIAGAAWATVLSRALTVAIGFALLHSRFGVSLRPRGIPDFGLARKIISKGAPLGASILAYAAVYQVLFALVLARLSTDVRAGLGIGFNAFESISFPFFLGVAIAGSSLVGRNLGANDRDGARLAVRNVRRLGHLTGAAFTALFLVGGPLVAPLYSSDPAVIRETVGYVQALAFSQFFVAMETVNEKVLQGAGHTRPIFWISSIGNLLRIPLAWLLAISLGWAGQGVWWAINVTTWFKAWLFHREVDRGQWLN